MDRLVENYLSKQELPDKFPSDGTRWQVIVEKVGKDDSSFESTYYFQTSQAATIFAKGQVEKGNRIEIWKLLHKW